MGVDELIPECAGTEVWPLWDISELSGGGFGHRSAIYWPQTAQDSEEGGFTTAIRSDNEQVFLSGQGVA
jgi:hypothetical protein